MKGSLTNSELHEFLHDFQSDETKENLEEFYLHNWGGPAMPICQKEFRNGYGTSCTAKFIPDRWNSGNLSMQRR